MSKCNRYDATCDCSECELDRAERPWRAWPDYGRSREHIVISARPSCAYLGYVQAWAGSSYWPVHDSSDRVVAYVRRELGGLYADKATEAESIQWAANLLMDQARSAA